MTIVRPAGVHIFHAPHENAASFFFEAGCMKMQKTIGEEKNAECGEMIPLKN